LSHGDFESTAFLVQTGKRLQERLRETEANLERERQQRMSQDAHHEAGDWAWAFCCALTSGMAWYLYGMPNPSS